MNLPHLTEEGLSSGDAPLVEDYPRTVHFTYKRPGVALDLEQGDLLEKTPELVSILGKIHPHYTKPDYTHFLVLSQSCDLVRRSGGSSKAPYISIAAVRPLSIVLERELAANQDDFERRAGICAGSKRERLENFCVRLFNNNDPDYFYLEAEPAFGLQDQSCAFLRLSVALKAREHYDRLLAAKRLSLTDVFQAKLGWLVGNMYSRVGTPDWADHIERSVFDSTVNRTLDALCSWHDPLQIKEAQKALKGSSASPDEVRQAVKNAKPRRKKDDVIEAAVDAAVRAFSLETQKVTAHLSKQLTQGQPGPASSAPGTNEGVNGHPPIDTSSNGRAFTPDEVKRIEEELQHQFSFALKRLDRDLRKVLNNDPTLAGIK